MPGYAACLVDVFDTALSVDAERHFTRLAGLAGTDPATVRARVEGWARAATVGEATLAAALADVFEVDGDGLERLLAEDRRLLRELTRLHDDTVPFLRALRDRGVRTAFVSNCADNTRPLLEDLGLAGLVDELVLSCEVGVAKPDAAIFEVALDRLGVGADEALFVDDQPAFCDAATALGIHAVHIDRFAGRGDVGTLDELLPRL